MPVQRKAIYDLQSKENYVGWSMGINQFQGQVTKLKCPIASNIPL